LIKEPALLKAAIITYESTYKNGKRFEFFINVNGVKVALQKLRRGTGKTKLTSSCLTGKKWNNPWLPKELLYSG
jgi:hypothetical protein